MSLSDNPRGSSARPLLESEIKGAQLLATDGADCARILNVSYATYKKWAVAYDLFEPFKQKCIEAKNKRQIKKTKVHSNPNKGKYPLMDILKGKYPNYPVFKLKDRLFKCEFKEEKCENCGWTEKRLSDGKGPFILDFKDSNPLNKQLENLQILCMNCAHNIRGYINRGKKEFHHNLDLDKMQREKVRIKIINAEEEKIQADRSEALKSDDDIDFSIGDIPIDELEQLLGGESDE